MLLVDLQRKKCECLKSDSENPMDNETLIKNGQYLHDYEFLIIICF